jgi:hypothetical protein
VTIGRLRTGGIGIAELDTSAFIGDSTVRRLKYPVEWGKHLITMHESQQRLCLGRVCRRSPGVLLPPLLPDFRPRPIMLDELYSPQRLFAFALRRDTSNPSNLVCADMESLVT